MSTQQLAEFKGTLAKMEKQFSSLLPKQIPTAQFLRTAYMAVENNPYLLKLDKSSLYAACQKAAQDGLVLDNREAAIVPFKNQAQYMPMVAGIIKKARQSGQISTLTAHVVYENDAFDYWVDEDGPHLKHRPLLIGDPGNPILAYATAKLKDGSTQIEVMTEQQIEKVKGVSRSKSGGIWDTWKEEMWRKTVIRRICKYLPSSTELDRVFESDNKLFDLKAHEVQIDSAQEQPEKQVTKAQEILESYAETVVPEDINESDII